MPIRYVPPTFSESLAVTAVNASRPSPTPSYCAAEPRVELRRSSTPLQILAPQLPGPAGRTRLSNAGLFEGERCDAAERYSLETDARPDRHNVYDPRFTGYCGDQFRPYVDPVLGSVKYRYDDIDDVKLVRFVERDGRNVSRGSCGAAAVIDFAEDALVMRSSVQRDWLLRRYEDRLQRTSYPLHTMGVKI